MNTRERKLAKKEKKKPFTWGTGIVEKVEAEGEEDTTMGIQANDYSVACSDMLKSFKKLFLSGDLSDMTIFCGDQRFKVHRVIICPRSKVLARMCQKGEGAFEEALTGEIHLEHDDPMIVEKMISFLYTLDYADNTPHQHLDVNPSVSMPIAVESESTTRPAASPPVIEQEATTLDLPHSEAFEIYKTVTEPIAEEPQPAIADNTDQITPLVLNARVYIMGERYDIYALRHLAQQKFEARAKNDGWNSEVFSLAIREVYEWTTDQDQGLRQLVVTIAAENITTLRDRGEFNNVLNDVPDFTRQLLDEVLKKAESAGRDCSRCQNDWPRKPRLDSPHDGFSF